ncbi:kinase-like protein, partial [Hortaea werneckii]
SFRRTVERYRTWLEQQYGGVDKVKDRLVFAHNDTQYGNILRMMPTGESPLLLPANTHKQLVVIDFEYANANCPGLEFANHFTEWTYNYHDERKPYACNTARYPTPEEQDRFVRAYIRHQPQHSVSTPKMTPLKPPTGSSTSLDSMGSRPKPTSNYSDFMLDARAPPGAGPSSQPSQDEITESTAAEDADVARLLHETRLWRLANTTQWVAWGIVQAKVPGMPDFTVSAPPQDTPPETAGEEAAREELGERGDEYRELARMDTAQSERTVAEDENVEEEFDYLGYAQHRALWFWSDALQLGIVAEGDLPEELLERVRGKGVPY